MLFRTALASLAVAALCVSGLTARADTITFDASLSSGGTYKYDFSQTNNVNGLERFTPGSVFAITGLSGVTGASSIYPIFFTSSFTNTSASFTVIAPGALNFSSQTFPGIFTVTSSLLTLGAAQYSIPTMPTTTTGSVLGPVAAVAVTPEPSSFALLGTGLLGVAGVLRKRFV